MTIKYAKPAILCLYAVFADNQNGTHSTIRLQDLPGFITMDHTEDQPIVIMR